jgi:hypothetical protein
MIVREDDGWWLLIRQVDHSALAGDLARHWGNATFERPEPQASVVIAATMHDEGWREQDELPRYDATRAGPLHWRDIPVQEHVAFYAVGIERTVARDPYAGLLASMHGAGIYTQRYGTFPVAMTTITPEARPWIETFIRDQEALQAELKRRLWSPQERRSRFERRLWTNYEWLQIYDRLSLFLCLHDLRAAAEDRLGPTPLGMDAPTVDLTVAALGDGVVVVEPWPFDVPEVTVALPVRRIPHRPYAHLADLQGAVRAAAEELIRARLVSQP